MSFSLKYKGMNISGGGGISEEELASKQDRLTGQSGQVVGFDGMGLAYAVRGWSNPNLLDNWYFADPINQLGQTEYAGGLWSICIDRWMAHADVTLEDGWIKLQNNSDVHQSFAQNVEPDVYGSLIGSKVTVSVLYRCSQGNVSMHTGVGFSDGREYITIAESDAFESDNEIHLKSMTFDLLQDLEGVHRWQPLSMELLPETTIYLKAAKCELGSQQTLAHQDEDGNWVLNDLPPNYALELAKCQRYMLVLSDENSLYCPIGVGGAYDTRSIELLVSVPTTLRRMPAVSMIGNYFLRGAGTVKFFSVSGEIHATIHNMNQHAIGLTIGGLSGLTNGRIYELLVNNDLTAKLIFDANL